MMFERFCSKKLIMELILFCRVSGFPVNRMVQTAIVRRYADRNNKIRLTDFIIVICKLTLMFRKYTHFSPYYAYTPKTHFYLNFFQAEEVSNSCNHSFLSSWLSHCTSQGQTKACLYNYYFLLILTIFYFYFRNL